MPASRIILIVVLVLAGLLTSMSAFTVSENQNAVVIRLGEITRVVKEPGLHFKVPFINAVKKYESRLITHDARPEAVMTGEKKEVLVDFFVKWRIIDVSRFYVSFQTGESGASLRLGEIIKNGLQLEFGKRKIREVVSEDRQQIMTSLKNRANKEMEKFGIEIFDVRVKQIELPLGVKESVFKRMRTERERIAREHRANGRKNARIIKADADKRRVQIEADGRKKAEQIKGEGDALATRIYAQAYGGKNAEFYAFYRSLEAYRNTFNNKGDIVVIEPDSEFFRYFGGTKR